MNYCSGLSVHLLSVEKVKEVYFVVVKTLEPGSAAV